MVQFPPAAMPLPVKPMLLAPAVPPVIAPPQLLVTFGTAATRSPGGKLSVTATPVSARPAFGLVMMSVSVDVPPTGILVGENDLAMLGGSRLVPIASTALPVFPVPPLVEVTLPVVLLYKPAVLPVTWTVIVQLAWAASVPPVRLILLPPVSVTVPPLQLPTTVGGVANTTIPGSVSVTATPASAAAAFGVMMTKVMVDVPLSGMLVGANDLMMRGGWIVIPTARTALPVLPLPPFVEVTVRAV